MKLGMIDCGIGKIYKALEEKQKGNEAYKKKDFTTAHLHYDKAIQLDPTDIIFRNNKAAVYFEQKDYDKCIEVSEEAITIGTENGADHTLIAKALARAGKAYIKKEDDDSALRYLHKSLSEHRITETQKLCYEVDKRMKEKDRLAYLDPEKALEAKTLGNEHFKKVYTYTMTPLQKFIKKLEEEVSDDERSILLLDIMYTLGFSKGEREILINEVRRTNEVLAIWNFPMGKLVGSTGDGLRGGIHHMCNDSDFDIKCTLKTFKLHTPYGNNINNLSLLPLQENEDDEAHLFVIEDARFPGYVKLQLAKCNFPDWNFCRMIDGRRYLLNSRIIDYLNNCTIQLWKKDASKYGIIPALDLSRIHDTNGPAFTHRVKLSDLYSKTVDIVYCIHYDTWPNSAHSFLTRRRPHNWPYIDMVKDITSQGCDVVGVGHHDDENNDEQWRISFPGEVSLLLGLTDVQILCYALLKIILRENLNTSQRELVSSFHIKHVLFWCVERCSPSQWVHSNYINCLDICLTDLKERIKARHIPHYFIESRNLFNSKLTEQKSKEIVDVLSKYDTTHVFRLPAFECVFTVIDFNTAQLKREALISTIMASFGAYVWILPFAMRYPYSFWNSYIPHNATKSLLNYENILQSLKKVKGVATQYPKYLIRSMIGFLNYVKYKESNKMDCLRTSRRQINKSLNMYNSNVRLRAATFFFTDQNYRKSKDICDTYLSSPPRLQRRDIDFHEYTNNIRIKVLQIIQVKETEEIESSMKIILQMSNDKWKLKYFPGDYDIVCIFRNFINIAFRDVCLDVIFMTAEKWVVPDPIKYELLSLPQVPDKEKLVSSGIYLDPMFVCIQTKFLCYHSMGNVHDLDKMLTSMGSFITNYTFTTQSSWVYLNMFAYCQIKAGQHRQSVKSILQSLRIFPSRYNAASGYLKIVLQILNSLSFRIANVQCIKYSN